MLCSCQMPGRKKAIIAMDWEQPMNIGSSIVFCKLMWRLLLCKKTLTEMTKLAKPRKNCLETSEETGLVSRTPSVLQNEIYEARELARSTFHCRGGYIDDKDAQERHSVVAFIRKMQLKNQTETLSHRSPKDYNKVSKCCWGCRNGMTMTHVELLGTLNAKATQGKQFTSLLGSTMQLLHERLRNLPRRNQSLN